MTEKLTKEDVDRHNALHEELYQLNERLVARVEEVFRLVAKHLGCRDVDTAKFRNWWFADIYGANEKNKGEPFLHASHSLIGYRGNICDSEAIEDAIKWFLGGNEGDGFFNAYFYQDDSKILDDIGQDEEGLAMMRAEIKATYEREDKVAADLKSGISKLRAVGLTDDEMSALGIQLHEVQTLTTHKDKT